MAPEIPLLRDARHWRVRADEARAVANDLTDPEAKRTMLGIAESYDALARRAALRDSDTAGK